MENERPLTEGEKLRLRIDKQEGGIYGFIFTYLYPINPLIELLGMKGFFLMMLHIFLTIMVLAINLNSISGRGSIIGWILILSSYLILRNSNIAVILFLILTILIYILGYYRLLTKKKYRKF